MQIAQLVSEADYTQAMARIRRLIEAEPGRGTPDGDRLEALVALVEAYEADLCLENLADIESR